MRRGRLAMPLWLALVCGALWSLAGPAAAHPLAPALLQLHETAPGQYAVLWRTSVTRTQRLDVSPQLPAHCRTQGDTALATEGGDAVVARWAVHCGHEGLVGQTLSVQGLAQSGINVIVQVQPLRAAPLRTLLSPEAPAWVVPAAQPPRAVFVDYLSLGLGHLLGGLDHLLFVAGLLWLVSGWRALVGTVTAFTLGHSVTLAGASLGWLRVPEAWAELGIALSLLLLAVVISTPRGRAGQRPWLARWPGSMAAGFGLLHGLGFAGALADIGLPPGDIAPALLAFNLGIEAGQLLWIAGLLAAQGLWRRLGEAVPAVAGAERLRALPVTVMGSLAAYWCFGRMATLLA